MSTSVGNIKVFPFLMDFDISISTVGSCGPKKDFYVSYMIVGV
jgi:hypothetical protein